MTALLAKATALALVKHPVVNSSCRDGKSFTYNSSVNIAVAVAIAGGLITPVLQDADKVPVNLFLAVLLVFSGYDLLFNFNWVYVDVYLRLTYIHCQESGKNWLIRPGPSSYSLMNTIQVCLLCSFSIQDFSI